MEKLDSKFNIYQIQQEMIEFWEKEDIFGKSVKREGKEMVAFDGPPFPTGIPHHGTVTVSFIKDLVARFFTMRGFSVPREWGWDCHGLPIENIAEKKLGLSSKVEIEKVVGVEKFNNECRSIVSANNENWHDYVRQMMRWVEYDNAYKTMDVNFMESVMWAFKECFNKGLIYEDYRVTPYCPRCQTPLSVSETRADDSTRPKQDTWMIAKFETKLVEGGFPVCFLAWTTTPWTLPSNMCLAVNKDAKYVFVKNENEVFVVVSGAEGRFEKVFGKNPEILKTVLGSELVGETYSPLFTYFESMKQKGAFKVIEADFVDPNDGIGIVHIAPAFGEDDYWACKKAGVPLVNPVNEKGEFTAEIADFAGANVMEANGDVIRFLKEKGRFVASGSIVHNYPHCWRCNTPLIYKAMDAWYFAVGKIKDRMKQLNETINWVPDVVKHGRFGNWLDNARDWNISRNRYWSTPLPVWKCGSCGKVHCLGSKQEIFEKSGVMVDDLHKHHLDKITFDCECGGKAVRVPEVLDCWFESGSVPFARMHFPFENKKWFNEHKTSDFVVEYSGQIRCWFYYLIVLSTALFDAAPFKNCIVHGTILDSTGKKLSKSSKNYTDPKELIEKFGTDAYRMYLFKSNAMILNDMTFKDSGVLECLQGVVIPLYNACSFLINYAQIDGVQLEDDVLPNPTNELDSWLLAKLHATTEKIIESMERFAIDEYAAPVEELIGEITNWHIRNSRRRFWASGESADKKSAYETLFFVLCKVLKLAAPLMPAICEKLFKSLTGKESVHLEKIEPIAAKFANQKLIDETTLVQNIIHLARSLRTKNNIKNRQPLSLLEIAVSQKSQQAVVEKHKKTIQEELNVKNVVIIENVSEIATVSFKPNFNEIKKFASGVMPQVIKAINSKEFIEEKNEIIICINGEKIALPNSVLLVEYRAKDGLNVANGNGIVVAMNLTITTELQREGVAREIVRNIQDMRKLAGLEIMDCINVCFKGDMVDEWKAFILAETLGSEAEFSESEALQKAEIVANGHKIEVLIKKSNA